MLRMEGRPHSVLLAIGDITSDWREEESKSRNE